MLTDAVTPLGLRWIAPPSTATVAPPSPWPKMSALSVEVPAAATPLDNARVAAASAPARIRLRIPWLLFLAARLLRSGYPRRTMPPRHYGSHPDRRAVVRPFSARLLDTGCRAAHNRESIGAARMSGRATVSAPATSVGPPEVADGVPH